MEGKKGHPHCAGHKAKMWSSYWWQSSTGQCFLTTSPAKCHESHSDTETGVSSFMAEIPGLHLSSVKPSSLTALSSSANIRMMYLWLSSTTALKGTYPLHRVGPKDRLPPHCNQGWILPFFVIPVGTAPGESTCSGLTRAKKKTQKLTLNAS